MGNVSVCLSHNRSCLSTAILIHLHSLQYLLEPYLCEEKRSSDPIHTLAKSTLSRPLVATMETPDYPVINVLFALHPGIDAMDFIGPLEVLTHALHTKDDSCKLVASL